VNHPERRWSCKVVAVSRTGRYNGARNIFYNGAIVDGEWKEPQPPECPCPGDDLRVNADCMKIVEAYYAD
jgi:hypothetical protein